MKIQVLTSMLILCVLIACGGGGGSSGSADVIDDSVTPPTTSSANNFAMIRIDVNTPILRIAYPMQVSVAINADSPANNVSVSLFAIEKNDDPEVDIRQFPLSTQIIAQVAGGNQSYDLDLTIPASLEFPGRYYIAAIIDSAEEVSETDEDDNMASIEVTVAEAERPNILIKTLALDRTLLLVSTRSYTSQVSGTEGNVYNADAGGTITVGADGLGPNDAVNIEAFASLRMTRSDTGTMHDVPLYLWNTAAGRYINAYGVDPHTPGATVDKEWLPLGQFAPQLVTTSDGEVELHDLNRDSAHINFYFPGLLGYELEVAMRHLPVIFAPTEPPPDLDATSIESLRSFLSNLPSTGIQGDESAAMEVMSFDVCVEIRTVGSAVVDDTTTDNELCTPLAISLPPFGIGPPPPAPNLGTYDPKYKKQSYSLMSGDGYSTKHGGKVFAFSLEFGSTATADDRGYIEQVRGAVPVTIFGHSFDFESVTVTAQLVPDYVGKPLGENSGYNIEQRFLGALLYSVDLPPTSAPPVPLLSYSKSAPDPELEQQFFVGPVPLIAGASITGTFGVEYQFAEFSSNPIDGYQLGSSISTFANLEATLFAGVGTKAFSAGVEGVLTLLDERITLFGGTSIEVLQLGSETDSNEPADFIIKQGIQLTNEFTGPQGKLNLYAKYSVPGFKKCSWGFVTGKCPTIVTLKSTKNIWKSKALFHFEDILFESNDVEFEVVKAAGQPAAYFIP